MKMIAAALLLLLTAAPCHAGGAIIRQPGRMPVYVSPMPGGGYEIQRPGEMPTADLHRADDASAVTLDLTRGLFDPCHAHSCHGRACDLMGEILQ